MENIFSNINIPRNRYINEAIESYNKIQRRKIIEQKLALESVMVGDDSMSVLKEFEEME